MLATVVAQTAQFATLTMSYPLTVENNGGTWMVAAIDLIAADRRIRSHPRCAATQLTTRKTP